jgi:hypothetical protein
VPFVSLNKSSAILFPRDCADSVICVFVGFVFSAFLSFGSTDVDDAGSDFGGVFGVSIGLNLPVLLVIGLLTLLPVSIGS